MADAGVWAGAVDDSSEYEEPLLFKNSTSGNVIVEGVVDYVGGKVIDRKKLGGWKSATLIIGGEIIQSFTWIGIVSNLISYLTGPLRQSTVTAAANINAWEGVSSMLPIVGAFVADSYLGSFRTILVSYVVYILGLGLLTLSTVLPSLRPPNCANNEETTTTCTSPTFQSIFFFASLYLIAIGNAGYKPCACAFGANQFDNRNPEEYRSKSSFFNWWNFAMCFGSIIACLILNYIQDNLSWGFGFGIPCICMIVGVILFLFGTRTYRYGVKEDKENPLMRITQVFVVAAKNWRTNGSSSTDVEFGRARDHQFKFLDKALIDTSNELIGSKKQVMPCSISQVEDAKVVLGLVPIWITCLTFAVVFAQPFTLFTKQASTMDRSLGSNFQIPSASIHIFASLSVTLFIVIYDRLFVPFFRVFTGIPNGITMLQRIGCGIFLSMITMVVAAIVEQRRLQIALDFGLVDMPKATVPMSVWWLVPQYVLFGLSGVFAYVGLQEFFYDQMQEGLKSVGLSFFYSLHGIGSFFSCFLIYVVDTVTGSGQYSWFADNLNRAHLDYFYWLLAGLSILEFVAFLFLSKSYLYNKKSSM